MKVSRLFIYLLTLGLYALVAYAIPRHQTVWLLGAVSLLFVLYGYWVRFPLGKYGWLAAIGLRLVFLFSIPTLSDDVYRFLWDGHLLLQGIHPFQFTPSQLMQQTPPFPLAEHLFPHLNSPHYYSVYPPLNQAFFGIAAWLGGDSFLGGVVVIRLIILMAEVGTMYGLKKLLVGSAHSEKYLAIYAFNPLIIIELTGNLHFEAAVICFCLASFYLLQHKQWLGASLCLALAILTKLTPLLLLPLLLNYYGRHLGIRLVMATLVWVALGFLPLLLHSSFLQHLGSSLQLYVNSFEFNASLYYLIRALGWLLLGYNIIAWAGKGLALAAFGSISWLSFQQRLRPLGLGRLAAIVWSIYLFSATTVHPWYIAPLVAFAAWQRLYFPLVWSGAVFLSYTAYTAQPVAENPYALVAEYALVAAAAWLDWKRWRYIINFSNK